MAKEIRLGSGLVLATNLDPQELDEWAVLDTYKAQSSMELSFQLIKSQACFADALFWKKPARIEGPLTLICLSFRGYSMAQLRRQH
ncbi:MAG: hypothetical protein QGI86_11640 [Candidatus Poribacteria bacterium]|nr:hypothetical protein [Candidatus Poribacteria bacterium]MDP6745463.1 hypothetical protein [Candidatus Poribacteria bacterium]MDP6995592.1 hypothetical protein [Candidatus Poribacteria bacterium]